MALIGRDIGLVNQVLIPLVKNLGSDKKGPEGQQCKILDQTFKNTKELKEFCRSILARYDPGDNPHLSAEDIDRLNEAYERENLTQEEIIAAEKERKKAMKKGEILNEVDEKFMRAVFDENPDFRKALGIFPKVRVGWHLEFVNQRTFYLYKEESEKNDGIDNAENNSEKQQEPEDNSPKNSKKYGTFTQLSYTRACDVIHYPDLATRRSIEKLLCDILSRYSMHEGEVFRILKDGVPHQWVSPHEQKVYLHSLLKIALLYPSLASRILRACIEQLCKLDVWIDEQWEKKIQQRELNEETSKYEYEEERIDDMAQRLDSCMVVVLEFLKKYIPVNTNAEVYIAPYVTETQKGEENRVTITPATEEARRITSANTSNNNSSDDENKSSNPNPPSATTSVNSAIAKPQSRGTRALSTMAPTSSKSEKSGGGESRLTRHLNENNNGISSTVSQKEQQQLEWRKEEVQQLEKSRRNFVKFLLAVFEDKCLDLDKAKNVPFIFFYLCSLDRKWCDQFIMLMLRIFYKQNALISKRKSSVCCIASLVCRAKFIPVESTLNATRYLIEWLNRFLKDCLNDEGVRNAITKKQMPKKLTPEIQLFHTTVQNVCYILCYKAVEFLRLPGGDSNTENDNAENGNVNNSAEEDSDEDSESESTCRTSPLEFLIFGGNKDFPHCDFAKVLTSDLKPLLRIRDDVRDTFFGRIQAALVHQYTVLNLVPEEIEQKYEDLIASGGGRDENGEIEAKHLLLADLAQEKVDELQRATESVPPAWEGHNTDYLFSYKVSDADCWYQFDPCQLRNTKNIIDEVYCSWEGERPLEEGEVDVDNISGAETDDLEESENDGDFTPSPRRKTANTAESSKLLTVSKETRNLRTNSMHSSNSHNSSRNTSPRASALLSPRSKSYVPGVNDNLPKSNSNSKNPLDNKNNKTPKLRHQKDFEAQLEEDEFGLGSAAMPVLEEDIFVEQGGDFQGDSNLSGEDDNNGSSLLKSMLSTSAYMASREGLGEEEEDGFQNPLLGGDNDGDQEMGRISEDDGSDY